MCPKQACVALLSTEAELITISEVCQEEIWIPKEISSHDGNQSCIQQILEEQLSNRNKTHRYEEIFRQTNGLIECKYCPKEEMVVNLLAKLLSGSR